MKRKEMYLAFRDGINKLMRKNELIEQYRHATAVLSKKSVSLAGTPEQKELQAKLRQITEETTVDTGDNSFAMVSFNPYLIRTTRSKLKGKVDALNELMREYNLR